MLAQRCLWFEVTGLSFALGSIQTSAKCESTPWGVLHSSTRGSCPSIDVASMFALNRPQR